MNKYVETKGNEIHFSQSGNSYNISEFESMEVKISPHKKSAKNTILNATANALSGSVSNGNEQVDIFIQIKFCNDSKEIILINDKPVVRFSLDYHSLVRKARTVENDLTKIFG